MSNPNFETAIKEIHAKYVAIALEYERFIDENIQDFHPVVATELPSGITNNIVVNLKFWTNDESDYGRTCYILTRKIAPLIYGSPLKNSIFQGYGVAWRIGSDPKDNNIFIVDNGAVERETIVDHRVVTGRGLFSYLASGYTKIEPNVWYRLKMIINSRNGVTIYIWPDGESPSPQPSIIHGAQSEEPEGTALELAWYTPIADYEYTGNRYFGIGIDGTQGYIWKFDDLKIDLLDLEYVHLLFSFEGSNLPTEFDIDIVGYGVGADEEDTMYGFYAFAWNFLTAEWDLVGTSTATPDDYHISGNRLQIQDLEFSKYVDPVEHVVNLQLSSKYPSNPEASPEPIESELAIDYIVLAGTLHPGYHLRGKTDLYKRGTLQEATTKVLVPESGKIFITSDDFTLPIGEITSVVLLDDADNELFEIEYNFEITNDGTGLRYSTKEKNRICVSTDYSAFHVKIYYTYFSEIGIAQGLLDSDDRREPCRDYVLFSYTPYFVDIDISYTGETTIDAMTDIVTEYINKTAVNRIEYIKILDLFMDENCTPDMTTATITAEKIDKTDKKTSYDLVDKKVLELNRTERPILRTLTLSKS